MPSRASNAVLMVDSRAGRDIEISLGRILSGRRGAFVGIWRGRVKTSSIRRPGQAKREPGPITTDIDVARCWSGISFDDERRWLWVPAFAGTTKSGSRPRAQPFQKPG